MDVLTWVEISRSALLHNVLFLKRQIGDAALFVVVKSNAYGHGAEQVVRVLNAEPKVAGFMVASLDEALALRTRKRIVVLSMWQRDSKRVLSAVHRGIELPVYDEDSMDFLSKLSTKHKVRIPVHIKIDVGTSRIGFRWDDLGVPRRIASMSQFMVKGVYSHFADSESADERFTVLQDDRFRKAVARLRGSIGTRAFMAHIACSAASLKGARYRYDAARVGIGVYGLWPSRESRALMRRTARLEPVMCWKTRIVQVKELKAGETIGYGMTYRAKKAMRIAVLPVGYWDGYDRKASNAATVLIGGRRCPVRGRICMNLTMVEVPRGLRVRSQDVAVLLGTQGKASISAETLASIVGTIHYEIVTRINPLIPRIITD